MDPESNIKQQHEDQGFLASSNLSNLSCSSRLPERLTVLEPLASNLYWVWNRKIRRIFEEIDLAAWDGLGHNPVLLLQRIGRTRLDELALKDDFLSKLDSAYAIQREYLHVKENTWYHKTFGLLGKSELVAYFSAEFGLTECLRTYSGGLGILSGDHLKSASDLGIPLIGVGLFYKRGYFTQGVNDEGWQIESYPENNPVELPVEPVMDRSSNEPLIVSVPIEDRQVRVRAWRVAVGRVTLLLLDTNLPGLNSKQDCEITAELYGGDVENRIKQEMILGFGGTKVIRALALQPSVYHLNEGHAAFAILERIREIMEEDKPGTGFTDAAKYSRKSNLFTTHTPVSAGIDVFDKSIVEKYLGPFCKKIGITTDELLKVGQEYPESNGFNMAVFAIRMSSDVNAVSKLHRRVASKLWRHVIETGEFEEIASVTNGIHTLSWTSNSFADLYDEFLGPSWKEDTSNAEAWSKIKEIPDDLLWQTHLNEKGRLIEYIRTNFSFSHYEISSPQDILDPRALTIGFARRFATYKRATLILRERETLLRLLRNKNRPIQFIFAGKAHPRDHEAKKLIQEILAFAKTREANGRIVFLPDYDITVARHMVQGVDLWLNNPQRPLEACGTSGMKSLPNGALNFSIADGWWDEAHSSDLGWTITPLEFFEDPARQSHVDAEALFTTLENDILPEFFERNSEDVPLRWVQKMKNSISTLTPRFTTRGMVREYAERFYFKNNKKTVEMLNKSELGSDILDSASNKWDR